MTEEFRTKVLFWLTAKHSLRKEAAEKLLTKYEQAITSGEHAGRSPKGIAYDLDATAFGAPVAPIALMFETLRRGG